MGRTGRKSIWDTPTGKRPAVGEEQNLDEQAPSGGDSPVMPVATPKSVVEQLRVAAEKKRDRKWERENRSFLIRGVPPQLTTAIKEISVDLDVKTDDVARAFLEFGLECHRKGEINLTPVMSDQRLTLFPKPVNGWQRKKLPGWVEKMWDSQPPQKPTRRGKSTQEPGKEKAWRWQVSYRGIPEDVKETLRQLHQQHSIPLGEIVTALLGHSLEAYQIGRLALVPQPRIASNFDMKTR